MAAFRQDLSGIRRPQAAWAASLFVLSAAALMLLWAAAPARATTQVFSYTGAEQTFAVPGGVHSIGVVVIGGVGGSTADASGGEAAEVAGKVTVTPGQTLYVEVGGKGKNLGEGGAGGFNGGGAGAGGGGGASDIRTSPRASGLSPDPRLIVAAGGGGAGGSGPSEVGANGGAAGSPGGSSSYSGGGAGTATEGGAGAFGCEPSGQGGNGQLGVGGAGGDSAVESDPGGGGGGGYYGGGGGGGACVVGSSGGGGGSSLIPPLALQSLTSAAPKIEITYTAVPPSISIASPVAGGIYVKGQVVNAIYSCTHAEGVGLSSCTGTVANGAPIATSSIGSHSFTVEAEDTDGVSASQEVEYTVVVPPSISIASPVDGATYSKGQAVTAVYSCTPGEGAGVQSCAGPVFNGASLDTSTVGPHTFTVNAKDTDGGTASKSVSYTVAAVAAEPPPDTILDSHPKSKIETKKKKVKVKFSFSSQPAGASFKCKLDNGDFTPCKSPQSYKVKAGKHVFEVEAVTATQVDPTPASFSFKVKRKPKKAHHPHPAG
jgi:Glycine rich protein